MIYAAIFASLGWHTFCDALPKGEKLLALIGLAFYIIGILAGHIIEDRLNDRIKKLEKELGKEVK